MIPWNCPHILFQDAAAGPSPAHHSSLSHINPVLLPTLLISITVLLRKKKLRIWCSTLEEPLGDFQMSVENFYPAHEYQTVELCSTAASLPDSSRQGWQSPASCWKEESSSRHLQPAYSCCSTFQGNLSLYCQHHFVHNCRCDKFASDDLWEGKSAALKVCQWYHLAHFLLQSVLPTLMKWA